MSRVVVLLSGGMDSATTFYLAREAEHLVYALSFDYGQRHSREMQAARSIAKAGGAKQHKRLSIDLGAIGGSALTDPKVDVPQNRAAESIGRGVPPTYVPARNTILLSYGLAYAEVSKADRVYIGATAVDFSGYPDCRPEYFKAFQRMANLATKRGVQGHAVRIEYPLIRMSKADIVREGERLGVPFELTWSCYLGGSKACGTCDACQLRLKGFREAGSRDPIPYAEGIVTSS